MISLDMMVYALIGLALLFLIIKLLKWPLKILINGILGIILLYISPSLVNNKRPELS